MAETAYRNKLVVIQDGLLTNMASGERFTKEFPFLRALQAVKPKGCGTCGSGNQARSETFSAVKRQIAGLATDRKQTLKRLLDTKHARVIYRRDDGRTIELTF